MEDLTKTQIKNISKSPFLKLIRFFIKPCQIFGVFPFEIRDNLIHLSQSYPLQIHNVYFVIGIFTMVFQLTSLVISISKGYRLIDLLIQSLWPIAFLFPCVQTVGIFFKKRRILQLFNKWLEIEKEIGIKNEVKWINRIVGFYFGLFVFAGLGSMAFASWHCALVPNYPVYILYYLPYGNGTYRGPGFDTQPNPTEQFDLISLTLHTIGQNLIFGWFSASYVIFEIPLLILSHHIVEVLHTIEKTLDSGWDLKIAWGSSSNILKEKLSLRRTIEIFQSICGFVDEVNVTLGPLLFIYISQAVVLCCMNIFIQIRSTSILQGDAEYLDKRFLFFVMGVSVNFAIRMTLLIIGLGGVYSEGLEVGRGLAAFSTLSPVSDSVSLARCLAPLAVWSAAPVAFSAWGFLHVTRGTLLGISSLIVTYIVVLNQSRI